MKEFDLDAALARRPSLLLVDEYAHTNVPGSRHPKRWQDIDEILAAGIDVWTTLNIQHLESLNDVVLKITKVRVRETVPDTVFDKADEIILVDFPPDELLKRLAEGKVYVQDTAARAVESFFKPQNLTALRELALRRAAERIDADLVSRMQAQAIEGPWAAGERILACIGPDTISPTVVRTAKRLADLMDAPWLAVTVERPGTNLDEAARRRLDDAMKLAQALGAETQTLTGSDLPAELLRFAKFENVTQIVIGRSHGGFFSELLHRSLPHELVRRTQDIAIHVVTRQVETAPPTATRRRARFVLQPLPFLYATLAIGAALAIGEGLTALTPIPNLSMLFLVAVLLIAVNFGIWPAIYASGLSFLVYNFFFIEPLYTFTIAEPYELLALVIFLVVAVITSALAGRVREQATISADRMRAMRRLYEFTRRLSGLASFDAVAEGAASEINASLGRAVVVLLEQDGDLALIAAWPPEDALDAAPMTAARWAFSHGEPAGADTGTLPIVPWYFVPLADRQQDAGRDRRSQARRGDAAQFRSARTARCAIRANRCRAGTRLARARHGERQDRDRNRAGPQHAAGVDLARFPHAVVVDPRLGDQPDRLWRQTQCRGEEGPAAADQAGNRRDSTRWCAIFSAITRIDAGALELRRDWIDLREIVDRVTSAARRRGARQHIDVALPSDLPLARADATLVEQAIGNVIGNAIVHTPVRDARAWWTRSSARKRSLCALPMTVLAFRRKRSRRYSINSSRPIQTQADGGQGTGLGLAIAKGIMEAHGGSIAAESPHANGRGTRIVLTFPREDVPA